MATGATALLVSTWGLVALFSNRDIGGHADSAHSRQVALSTQDVWNAHCKIEDSKILMHETFGEACAKDIIAYYSDLASQPIDADLRIWIKDLIRAAEEVVAAYNQHVPTDLASAANRSSFATGAQGAADRVLEEKLPSNIYEAGGVAAKAVISGIKAGIDSSDAPQRMQEEVTAIEARRTAARAALQTAWRQHDAVYRILRTRYSWE